MNALALWAVAGAALIAVANYDALVTTMALGSGSRPLTAHVATLLRRVLRWAPRLIPAAGPVVLLATVAVWLGLLWAGYSMLFLSDADAVASTATGLPAAPVSRVYYAGYTLFTLGNGGYAPAAGVWEMVTVLATLNGLFVVTLAITYLIPVVSAVVERRQMSSLVTALGSTVEDVVVSAWNGRDFSFLEQQLPGVSRQILLTAQRHLAYPVLHDFQSRNPNSASERTLALLDDVLLVVEHGVDPSVRLSPPVVKTARFAIDEVVRLMPATFELQGNPPLPDVAELATRGIPMAAATDLAAAARAGAERRRRLATLVHTAAWPWPNRAGEVRDRQEAAS